MASSKSLMDNLLRPAKRIKASSHSQITLPKLLSVSSLSSTSSDVPQNNSLGSSPPSPTPSSPSGLTDQQKLRIELNRSLAKSKRNVRICSEKVSKSKAEGVFVGLEELLVEETWLEALPGELRKPYAKNLCKFVEREVCGGNGPIYPPLPLIFNALNSTPFDRVKVVIIGQDPYHGPGQAMGLAFSVPEGVKMPSSLVNIFKELQKDLGCSIPSHGNLERWAIQGGRYDSCGKCK